ncbi:putative serine/threonine-protein kinase [Cercophora samala]|uniref:non-specific serine/threonine protein kinase n=1 Tax=Cercophora samala TaxID=330535 RepID=A0AA40DBV6_9PEZI|nr:putative serine/threonine-protein kinase [Cercophora samala]
MTSRTAQQHSQIASVSLGAGYKLDDNASVWSFAPSDRTSIRVSKATRRRFNILSAFKSLTNLASDKPPAVKTPDELSSGYRGAKSIISTGISKMSSALLRAPMEPTVIHRTQPKSRPPLQQQTFHQRHPQPPHSQQGEQVQHIESFPLSPPQVITPDATYKTNSQDTISSIPSTQQTSNNNSGNTSPKNSTGQTSMDSSSKDQRKGGAGSPERLKQTRHANHQHNIGLPPSSAALSSSSNPIIRHHAHHNHNHSQHHRENPPQNHIDASPPSPDSILTTIQESPLDFVTPSIATVERAAAAKIALEEYFDDKFSLGMTDREKRRKVFEDGLAARGKETRKGLSSGQMAAARAKFFQQETQHLRELRVLKARGAGLLMREGVDGARENGFEEVQILGKGSFGVVKLVRKRDGDQRGKVFAMKCIRKGDMIKTQQEGHLKAERDFLIASEGCEWVVQLVASFQDLKNLYLVTEYMPGGDFLGFLIRENTLPEEVARFYVAEMILAVEATHSLRFMHRDIKPDNFLISASGHLKISDFGLAFDGHWSHDLAYFTSHRYSLVNRLGLNVVGDEQDKEESRSTAAVLKWTSGIMTGIEKHQPKMDVADYENGGKREPLLNWRNKNGNRGAAVSIMGTSQYMAPEVVKGECYDARCDYWSVAVILYECLYGSTPFFSEEGRTVTKKNILNHREVFHFPKSPQVSSRCRNLLLSLIVEKEERLCSKKYRMKDMIMGMGTGQSTTGQQQQGGGITSSMSAPSLPALGVATMMSAGAGAAGTAKFDGNNGGGPVQQTQRDTRWTKDYVDQFVFPNDAEDIRGHKWFRSIMWDNLHQMRPPHVPALDSAEDATYFDDESLSDWSESSQEEGQMSEGEEEEEDEDQIENRRLDEEGYHAVSKRALDQMVKEQKLMEENEEKARWMSKLRRRPSLQRWVMEAMKQAPFDIEYFGGLEREIDKTGPGQGITEEEKGVMKMYLWQYGCRLYRDGEPKVTKDKKEEKKKKRPRDKILRDKEMGKVAMEVRRRTAFAGYEWVGSRGMNGGDVDVLAGGGQENVGLDGAMSRLASATSKTVLPQPPPQQVQMQTPRQVVNVGVGMNGGYDGSPESNSSPAYRWAPPPQMHLPPPHALPAITGYAVQHDPFWRPPPPVAPQPQFTHARAQYDAQQLRQFSPFQQQQPPRHFIPPPQHLPQNQPQHQPQHQPQQVRNYSPYQSQYQSQIPRQIPTQVPSQTPRHMPPPPAQPRTEPR